MSSSYNRKDHLYNRAKEEGYASRASYKIIELDKRFGLLARGNRVLDLGAWPGGWLQVAAEKVGDAGRVVGIDLVEIEMSLGPNVLCIKGDVRDDEHISRAHEWAGGQFDLVMSDMSPKLTGIKEADAAGTVACAELAFYVAERTLRAGGYFVAKVFKSNDTEQFIRTTRPRFNKLVRAELDSTRKTSNEFYVVGCGYKPDQR